MKKIIKFLSIVLSVILLCNIMVSAEEKTPKLTLSNNNAIAGGIGNIAVTVDGLDDFVGGYNFEIKFPEIAQITNVYQNGNKLTSLANGGEDYNVRTDNTVVLAGTCNYGNATDLDNNTVYHIEFTTSEDVLTGEYPVEFTEDTYLVADSYDEELIFPVISNGKINISANSVYKADVDESGKVDAADIVVLRKWLIGLDCGNAFNIIAADVNLDREVNIKDLVALKKFLVKVVAGNTKKLPDTGGIVETVSGGADEEATALRSAINNAKDTLVVTGTKYYVSQNGNDTNDGTSPAKAFKTLQKVGSLGSKLKEGDGVFLERGSVFRAEADSYYALALKSGVTYGAYGSGEKPKVYGSVKNYADKSLWTLTESENIWMMRFDGTDAGIIVMNGGTETGKKQISFRELTVNDDFFHDWDDKMIYFYCDRGNPGEVFSQIEIGDKKEIFHLPNNQAQDITIDNISFSYTGTFGIRGSNNATNITITNCSFSWIGGSLFDDKSNRYGNGIEFTNGCENILVKNCSFDQIFDSGVTFQVGSLPYRNFTVEDCLFEYNGMSGFEWWTSGNDGEQDGLPLDNTVIENITIKNNIFRLTGYGWSKATRSPAHIRSGWSSRYYTNINNFTVSNNIFDCSNGQVIASCWVTPPEGYSLFNNTYYQRFVDMDKGMYLPFTAINNHKEYVSSLEEFIWAVHINDETAIKVEWLE